MYTNGKGTIRSPRSSGTGYPHSISHYRCLLFSLLRVLPEWLPFHPSKWWMHCRMVYLPMSYIYGIRLQAKETDLILSLREVRLHSDSPKWR